MYYSKEEVKEFIEQEDVKFVRLAFCDINKWQAEKYVHFSNRAR